MELMKAVRAVVKFAAKGAKAPALYQTVLFQPALGNYPAFLFSTDGVISCVVTCDLDLPFGLVSVADLAPIAKHKISGIVKEGTDFVFQATTGGSFRVPLRESLGYPKPPLDRPAVTELVWWDHIWPVFHAAASDNSKTPTFKNIRFRVHCVEATDSVRVAVADVPAWERDQLVPAKLFKGWKNGRVFAFFSPKLLWVQKGEETRFMIPRDLGTFPDCKAHVPAEHGWPALVIGREKALDSLKKAITVSSRKAVVLDFVSGGLTVKSWVGDDGVHGYRMALSGVSFGESKAVTKVVNGKLLAETLGALQTPFVRFCFTDAPDGPIRVESGAIAECIWPWRI